MSQRNLKGENDMAKKTWHEKLANDKGLPKVERFDKNTKNWPSGTYVIPAPREVDAIMKKVPKGKLITIGEIRRILADKHGAMYGCPITTGIFSWIAANAAQEELDHGKKDITPYWRTLKTGGELNPKYPGGLDNLKSRLHAEGHKVIQKGRSKKFVVADYEKSLVKIDKIV